jgi:serine/threonine-protein kinase
LVWWVFATTVCFTIAKVIYGLRQEVARAQQLGQYTLEAKLGEGGMGVVYRARHAMLQRPTAVKLIDPEHNSDAQLARFEREVQLTTRLTHPNTITIYDYGRTLDGVFYYAMELLDGVTLEDVVDVDGAQPPERVVRILRQVAGALGEAHALGLIHRDIKPGNIMLCTRGGTQDVAKLLDFGLVKQVGGRGAPTVTAETKLIGTPMYMSPEAVMAPEAMDGRSDLYALGAVGYYLLTGDHVFKGATAVEVCGHHLHSRPPPLSERLPGGVPGTLDRLVLRCLAKRPDERPQSAHELLALLEDCGGSDAWTQTRAAAWWTTHRGALRSCAHVDPIEQRAFSARLRAPNQRGHTF